MRIQKAVIFAWVVASLLWAALVFLWARSYVVREIASVKPIGDAGRRVEVSTSRGEIALTVDYDASRRGQPRRWFHKAQPHDDSLPRFSFEDLAAITYHSTYWSGGGFGFMSAKPPDNPLDAGNKAYFSIPRWTLVLPFWFPSLVLGGALVFSGVPLFRRLRRQRLGLCMTCGYDLRASPEQCPECGAAVAERRKSRKGVSAEKGAEKGSSGKVTSDFPWP